jgi:hypothetical protein
VTTWFIGISSGVWAAGTPSALVPPTGAGQANFADAYTAAADGDVIRLAPGTHLLPATVGKTLHVIGYGQAVTNLQTADPSSTVADGKTLRVEAVTITGPQPVQVAGKFSAYRCTTAADCLAQVAAGGAGVAVWCGKLVQAAAGGAVGNYPTPAKTMPGGQSGRRIGTYRQVVALQAAAKLDQKSGQKKAEDWLTFADLRVCFDERTAREGMQHRLIVANATGLAYCRGGVPVHPDFRMVHAGRTLGIQGVNMSIAPRNELEIFYSERVA